MKVVRVLIIVFILAWGVLYVLKHDAVQREVAPEAYWRQQVRKLDERVRLWESIAYREALRLQELQVTMPMRLARQVELLRSSGLDERRAQEEAQVNVFGEIEEQLAAIETTERTLESARTELAQARQELSKYQAPSSEIDSELDDFWERLMEEAERP